MTVQAGKTYRIRIINAGSLLYSTVCFGRHNVTIIAADAYPVNPLTVSCVDINLGQRWVLLGQVSALQEETKGSEQSSTVLLVTSSGCKEQTDKLCWQSYSAARRPLLGLLKAFG